MGRARGANAVMAFGREGTYGTPPASGYTMLPFVSSDLGAEQPLIESDLLGLGRAPGDPTYDVVTNDGNVVVPLDNVAMGEWLRLLFGPPASTADTPAIGVNTHVFSSGAQNLPSVSIEIGHPDRPAYSTNYGIRANTLQIMMQRSGLVNATLGLIGKGETVLALTSSAGSPTAVSLSRFAAATGAVYLDGVQAGEVVQANLSYSNGLDKVEVIRPDGEISDVDAGMPSASIQLTVNFADIALYQKATSKTPVAIELTWTNGQLSLKFRLPRVFLPRKKRPITGPGKVQVQFDAQGASSSGVLMTATLANNVPGTVYA